MASPRQEIHRDNNFDSLHLQSGLFGANPRQMRTFWDKQSLFEPNKEIQHASENKPDFNSKNIKKVEKEESKSEIEEEKYQIESELSNDYEDDDLDEEGSHHFRIFSY